jgi:predicted nucleic acid-binding protein
MNGTHDTQERCFVDSNIWLYAFIATDGDRKRDTAKAIVQNTEVIVSTQVVNEVCVNLLKKTPLLEKDIQRLIAAFYDKYTVISIDRETLLKASVLREEYSLSFWDSLIVASALYADCAILYSEDMQDGMVVGDKLTIVSPFKTDVRGSRR